MSDSPDSGAVILDKQQALSNTSLQLEDAPWHRNCLLCFKCRPGKSGGDRKGLSPSFEYEKSRETNL
jgi:hypothetical protein